MQQTRISFILSDISMSISVLVIDSHFFQILFTIHDDQNSGLSRKTKTKNHVLALCNNNLSKLDVHRTKKKTATALYYIVERYL